MVNSIMQEDKRRCYLCGGPPGYYDPLDLHHVFNGSNKKKSEKYGLMVYLHHNKCHIFGKEAVHANAKNNRALKAKAQKIAMQYHGWDVDTFRRIFGKNYIEE